MFLRYFCLAIALAAVCLPQASGPAFIAGVVVMVTALTVHFLVAEAPATGIRYAHHAFSFAFATGALLTCAHGNYSLAAFIAMFMTFQVSRGRDTVNGPAGYLPDARALLQLTAQRASSLLRRGDSLTSSLMAPRSLTGWIPWVVPAATIAIALTKKALD